jgi:dTDP-4-amino-4,6-dideoxygalactose transaminase
MRSYENEVSLPIWPGMTGAMIERVIEAVLSVPPFSRKTA